MQKIVSLPALKIQSQVLICFPLVLFSTYKGKKKKFLKHRKQRLLPNADEPSLTYLLLLEESHLKKENGDYESPKNSRLQQSCTGCLPHFQLLFQASESSWTKASDTHRGNQKRGVGPMWFASSPWITACSSASSYNPLFIFKASAASKVHSKVAVGLPVFP